VGREKVHLERALQGWEQALHFMANATDIACWSSASLTSQRLGDYVGAANILGTIISSFPTQKNVSLSSIMASSILAELNQFEQAVAYMHNAMVHGAPQPLTNLHLMFFMSRLYDRWHKAHTNDPSTTSQPPSNANEQAKAGFARCYEFEAENGGMMFATEWAGLGANGWMNSYSTYVGERANDGIDERSDECHAESHEEFNDGSEERSDECHAEPHEQQSDK